MSRSGAGVTRSRWRELVAAVIDAIVRTAFDNVRLGTPGSATTGISVFTPVEKQRVADLCSHDPELAPADTGMLLGLLLGGLRRIVEMVITTMFVNLGYPPFFARVIAKLIVNWLFRHLKPLAVAAERLQNFGLAFLAFDGRIEDYPNLPGKLRTWGEGKTVAQIQNMLGVSPRADQEWASKSAPTASPGSDGASSSERNRAARHVKKRVAQALDEVLRPKKSPVTNLRHGHVDKRPASPAARTRLANRRKSEHENSDPPNTTVRPTAPCAESPGKKAPAPTEDARRRSEPEIYTPAASTDPGLATERQAEFDRRYQDVRDLRAHQDAARGAEPDYHAEPGEARVAGEREYEYELHAALAVFDSSEAQLAELAAAADVDATGHDRIEIEARAAEADGYVAAAGRPDGALSDVTLIKRITALKVHRAELAQRLDAARDRAEQAETELRAGPGPKEKEHQERLVVLEQRAELARQVAAASAEIRDLETQRHQARVQEMTARQQAQADRAPWIRGDVRATARTDIAAQQPRQVELDAQVQPVREHRDALIDHLGGPAAAL